MSKKIERHLFDAFFDKTDTSKKNWLCPGCGTKQEPPPEAMEHKCPHCGMNFIKSGTLVDIWWC